LEFSFSKGVLKRLRREPPITLNLI